jgi:hypothetical protein
MFATRIPRNNASRHDPNVIVSTPKNSRIPLGIVTVLARMMLAYERLERRRANSPRACRRRAASASVNPVGAMSVPEAIGRHYRLGGGESRALPRRGSGRRHPQLLRAGGFRCEHDRPPTRRRGLDRAHAFLGSTVLGRRSAALSRDNKDWAVRVHDHGRRHAAKER